MDESVNVMALFLYLDQINTLFPSAHLTEHGYYFLCSGVLPAVCSGAFKTVWKASIYLLYILAL